LRDNAHEAHSGIEIVLARFGVAHNGVKVLLGKGEGVDTNIIALVVVG